LRSFTLKADQISSDLNLSSKVHKTSSKGRHGCKTGTVVVCAKYTCSVTRMILPCLAQKRFSTAYKYFSRLTALARKENEGKLETRTLARNLVWGFVGKAVRPSRLRCSRRLRRCFRGVLPRARERVRWEMRDPVSVNRSCVPLARSSRVAFLGQWSCCASGR